MIFFGSKPRNGIAGSYTTSMFNVSRKLHAVFHHGFTSYSPTKTVGRFHFLYVLYSIYSLQIFSMMAIVTSVRWELIEVLIGIDLIIIDMEYLPICFYYFTPCEYSLPLETGFLKLGPVWNSFAMIFPRRFLEGRCHIKALLDLWLLRALQHLFYGFPANSVHLQCRRLAGDTGLIRGSGRSPGTGNSNPLQYSCLGNPMDTGASQATVHGVTQSQTRLSD